MAVLESVPVLLSFLVLAAHFFRGAHWTGVAAALALAFLLGVPRRWAARTIQAALLLGAAEWVRTLVAIAHDRMAAGQPYRRMAAILCAVALFTAASALVFRLSAMGRRYRLIENAP